MKHSIDPKVDCVFKALLGTEENRNLLIHFLNAILETSLRAPITSVDILNPYNEREFINDKLSVVDVKARDAYNKIFQIEIQMLNHRYLPARIVYNWADIYSQQLQSGEDYGLLKPTYAIWLLAENLIPDDNRYLHTYQLQDSTGHMLIDHGGIWILELDKFTAPQIETEQQRWLLFFNQAQHLDYTMLPEWMNTSEMRQAMATLRQFSEKERNYHEYQARQHYLRQQHAIQEELDDERKEKELALQREHLALQDKELAMQREHLALQDKELAMQREHLALQDKELALREVERLKVKLALLEGGKQT